MKRIEAQDLKPGDTFEYQQKPKYRDHNPGMVRDTVKPDGEWRSWWGPSTVAVDVRTIDRGPESGQRWCLIHTEVGQTNHQWVEQKADAIVLLIEEGDA